ncbi:hypothetical protein C789_894 [Microcystis aeruginosa FACHB-905 = DIANCHI905]|uniref:Uncharacterized protein n=1 Tax=Microcystis aeruginosa PCC 7806SL TaxID=1903187 RepID=A0AB33BVC0_MICA7|nr:hypothetical protein BH695_4623 [Microcystis aeruginosa PCC 7806SL]ELS49338.1 hypothetical protein C789_894 [Microcystis aeruginosa FACHB-905 = DIANCHI905]
MIPNPFLRLWLTPNSTLKTQLSIVSPQSPLSFKQDLI